jgi:vesicle-associated membrane protein 7/small nuclear ribonucleoprotein D3
MFVKLSKASIMYWRNMKLKLMLGLMFLSGLAYLAVPIIIKIAAK